MSERAIRSLSMLLAGLGATISAYLLYVRYTGGTLACATGGCETVQHSSYAKLVGVPVAALGLAAFLGILVAALARGEWAQQAQATLALSVFFFGGYLLYVQVVEIGALCQWCVATDVITSALAALALLRLRLVGVAAPVTAARSYPQPRPNGNRGPNRHRDARGPRGSSFHRG